VRRSPSRRRHGLPGLRTWSVLTLELPEGRTVPSVSSVTTTADSGPESLLDAIGWPGDAITRFRLPSNGPSFIDAEGSHCGSRRRAYLLLP
jgi:hypothetical protein